MATTITFQKGATSLTLPAPAGGYDISQEKSQALIRTAGNVLYVYDKGVDTYGAVLALESLSAAEKTGLQDFFDITVNGAKETFTYTDSSGNPYTAQFLDTALKFRKVAGGVYDVTFNLELDSMHS